MSSLCALKTIQCGREYQKKFPNILLLRTMSKVFGMAGSRVGVLIANRPRWCEVVNRVRKPFNIKFIGTGGGCLARS